MNFELRSEHDAEFAYRLYKEVGVKYNEIQENSYRKFIQYEKKCCEGETVSLVGLCKESGLNFLVIKFELSLQTGQIFKEEESNQEILMNPNKVLEFQILNL